MASSMTWEAARDELRKQREEQQRNSQDVVSVWENILCHHTYSLGDELWLIQEQVLIAALDCGRLDVSVMCLKSLESQFPNSNRVMRLRGLILEFKGDFEKAQVEYDAIMETDENNSLVQKRRIAMMKAEGKPREAIKELNNYLKKYMSDMEAWMELCDLYLLEQDYAKASFCMEELIMSSPHSHLYHQKYAEIKFTQGNLENMTIARRYFSQALKLNPNNMRALYGLFLAAHNITKSKDTKAKRDNTKYAAWAYEEITRHYQEKVKSNAAEADCTKHIEVFEKMLADL